MSSSTPLHSAHLAEVVEIAELDNGFEVTTSSTRMAEIAEIDPLHLMECGIESQGLYTAVSAAAVAAEAEALSCDTAGNAAAITTFAAQDFAIMNMTGTDTQANSATLDEGPCWHDVFQTLFARCAQDGVPRAHVEAALERQQADAGAIDVESVHRQVLHEKLQREQLRDRNQGSFSILFNVDAAAIAEQLSQCFTCAVCIAQLDEPVTTRCGHSFCSSCLRTYMEAERSPRCPVCKASVGSRTSFCTDTVERSMLELLSEQSNMQADTLQETGRCLLVCGACRRPAIKFFTVPSSGASWCGNCVDSDKIVAALRLQPNVSLASATAVFGAANKRRRFLSPGALRRRHASVPKCDGDAVPRASNRAALLEKPAMDHMRATRLRSNREEFRLAREMRQAEKAAKATMLEAKRVRSWSSLINLRRSELLEQERCLRRNFAFSACPNVRSLTRTVPIIAVASNSVVRPRRPMGRQHATAAARTRHVHPRERGRRHQCYQWDCE